MVRPDSLYYLLCYAWDHSDLASRADVAGLPNDRVADMLGHVLVARVSELLRRGLHREYVAREDELRSPRGKIDVSTHVRRVLRPSGRVACRFDELDHDVLINQIVGATLERLAPAVTAGGTARSLRNLARRMPPLSRVELSASVFAGVRLHRLASHYRFVLSLCELVTRSMVPDGAGGWSFIDFTGDQRAMGLLFEDFLRNFLKREQNVFAVDRNRIAWPAEPLTPGSEALLPQMETDVTLTRPGRRCVLEAKFNAEPLRVGRGGSARLRENHLYQLFAYLSHLSAAGKFVDIGVLLYATKGERFDHRYTVDAHEVRVQALDLDQPWEAIAADIRSLVSALDSIRAAA